MQSQIGALVERGFTCDATLNDFRTDQYWLLILVIIDAGNEISKI